MTTSQRGKEKPLDKLAYKGCGKLKECLKGSILRFQLDNVQTKRGKGTLEENTTHC